MTVKARRASALTAEIVEVFPLPGVRAGSALLKIGGRLLAIQDDAWSAVWIDPRTRRRRTLVFKGDGRALPKRDKPDFEAAMEHGGAVYVFGSGSKRNRRSIVRWQPGKAASLEILDGREIYRAVRRALKLDTRPNIEGACVIGPGVRLFHRGAGGARSASVDLELSVLEGVIPKVLAHAWYDLGKIGGAALSFTDVRAVGAKAFYLAVAEVTQDAISDGPVAGAAVGIIDAERTRWTPLLEPDGQPSRRKVEGLALDPSRRTGWLITDADDPEAAAELCRLRLRGPW